LQPDIYQSHIDRAIDKAKILIEALPYIKEFSGKIVVIKYGGSALINEEIKNTVMQDIALMKLVGLKPVVVHGGGPDINETLKRLGIESAFVGGLRVTTPETMEVVEMVLAGRLNKTIMSALALAGVKTVGISGKDGGTLRVRRKRSDDGLDLGLVGEVESVDTGLIQTLLDSDFVPVIAPVGVGEAGESYNVNADHAAVSIAGALRAEKLVYVTDVEGVLHDVNDKNSLITRLSASRVQSLIDNGTISGGMIPKALCCVAGVEAGVNSVHILDGRVEHCLILEIFTRSGVGTLIER